MRKRRKTRTYWIQDAQPCQFGVLTTANGVIDTTALAVTAAVSEMVPDPATREELEVQASGSQSPFVSSVRDQLTSDPGWRMIRNVGSIWLGLRQAYSGNPAEYSMGSHMLVRAALALLETDQDGVPIDAELTRHRLLPDLYTESALSKTHRMLGNSQSFLWMREWILHNRLAMGNEIGPNFLNLPLLDQAGHTATGGSGATVNPVYQDNGSFSPMGGVPIGEVSTDKYPSVHCNHIFDVKRHCTVTGRRGLFWLVAGVAMNQVPVSNPGALQHFTLDVLIRNRLLIARPGRKPRFNTR